MPVGKTDAIEAGMLRGDITTIAAPLESDQRRGAYFAVRNQFFHGTKPLGWFGRLRVAIDGDDKKPADTDLVVRDQWLRADQLETLRDIYWEKGETAHVFVALDAPLPAGPHEVRLTIGTSVQTHTRAVDPAGVRARGEVELVERLTARDEEASR